MDLNVPKTPKSNVLYGSGCIYGEKEEDFSGYGAPMPALEPYT